MRNRALEAYCNVHRHQSVVQDQETDSNKGKDKVESTEMASPMSTTSIWQQIEANSCFNAELLEYFLGIGGFAQPAIESTEAEKPEQDKTEEPADVVRNKGTKRKSQTHIRHKVFGKLSCITCVPGASQSNKNTFLNKDDRLSESRADAYFVEREQTYSRHRPSTHSRNRQSKNESESGVGFMDEYADSEDHPNDKAASIPFQYVYLPFGGDASRRSNVSLGSFSQEPDKQRRSPFMCTD